MSKPPIFIVGAPRSGTTLLRNILNRHPELAICGETRFYRYVYKRRRAFGDLSSPKNRRHLVEQYLSTERAGRLGMDLSGLGDRLLREATSYRAAFTSLLEFYAESQGKKRYGEKTPHHAFFTETLCEWYPGASILHLVRDPRDVVASLQRMRWAPHSVAENAWLWLMFNRGARRSRHRSGYLLVHYETLVTRPEQELARICQHVSEDYTPSMLAPKEAADGPYSWPRHARGPVTTERVAKWREQLTPEEVALTEWVAGREMPTFGYQREAGAPSILALARGTGFAVYANIRRHIEQFPGLWYSVMRRTQIAKEEYWKYRRVWEKAAAPSGFEYWNQYKKSRDAEKPI